MDQSMENSMTNTIPNTTNQPVDEMVQPWEIWWKAQPCQLYAYLN